MPRVLSAKQIKDLCDRRLRNPVFIERNERYDLMLNYYQGKQRGQDGKPGTLAMDGKGKPLLRDLGSAFERSSTIVANRLQPVVDDFQGLIGQWPDCRVEPPNYDQAAEAKAEKQTRFLYSTYQLANMDVQQAQGGFFLSCLGDEVLALEVDWDRKRVIPSVIDPRFCFPAFRQGWRRWEVRDCIVYYLLDVDTIEDEFDYTPLLEHEPEDLVQVITYYSEHQRTIIVGEEAEQVSHVEWDFDWCPLEWVHNKVTMNNAFAQSDISQALSIQDLYNFSLNIRADGLVEMTYPIRMVRNPMSFGQDQIPIGPGQTVPVEGTDGDLKLVAPTPNPVAAQTLASEALEDIMASAGTNATRMSGEQPGSSVATGKGIHAAQQPQSSRIALRQIVLGAAAMRLNSHILEMQEKAPLLDRIMQRDGVEIWGRFKGQSFLETIKADDIDGWYRNHVIFDEMIGVSPEQKIYIASQGLATGLTDDLWSRDRLGIEDPMGMRERVEAMEVWKAQLQQKVQKIQGATEGEMTMNMPGGTGIAAQGMNIRGVGRGGGGGQQQQQPPPQQIMLPPQMAKSTPPLGGGQAGVGVEQVRQALELIADRLRGTVWAIGGLAMQGADNAPTVLISDPKDYQFVLQSLRVVAPNVKVRAVPESAMPPVRTKVA